MSGSGISWTVCKSAPRSRQTITPAPHHAVFYRPDALPATQPTASKHLRHRYTDMQTDRHADRHRDGETDIHTYRQMDRQTNRWTDRQMGTQNGAKSLMYNRERIFKIGLHLAKLWTRVQCSFFLADSVLHDHTAMSGLGLFEGR